MNEFRNSAATVDKNARRGDSTRPLAAAVQGRVFDLAGAAAGERTPFESGLIEHTRAFCRKFDSHSDKQTQAAIWLVMSSLREWEEKGAEAALARVQAAYEAKANRA